LLIPVNSTGATAVRHPSKIAVIQPTRPAQAVSSQSPFCIVQGRSGTAPEARSVGLYKQKDHSVSYDTLATEESIEHKSGGAMRIFIFKSEANPELRAFSGDLAGTKLPRQFKPWRAVGAIAPNQDPPYKIARDGIEKAINEQGFQLFRFKKRTKAASG
jgi:hypothetical protein